MRYINTENERNAFTKRQNYLPPKLICYGCVNELTQSGGSHANESNGGADACTGPYKPCNTGSDRIIKDNIVRVGTHSLGIGLYLFDYKPKFRDAWGHGRQFGVMADEVEQVMPEAVSVHPDGYKMVNYTMLGISRNLH